MPGSIRVSGWAKSMTTTITNRGLPAAEDIVGPTPGQQMRRRIFGHYGLLFGGGILIIMFLMAILAPVLPLHDPYAQELLARMRQPVWMNGNWDHILGTDHLGRDFLARLVYGAAAGWI